VIAWTDPADVARAEKDTFICSKTKAEAGPTNNWMEPAQMRAELSASFDGCMEGRTMYVVPFSMGTLGSAFSKVGVELTDSAFVVANMRIMTRMGAPVLESLQDGPFIRCMHSVARPLRAADAPDSPDAVAARQPWPCNIAKRRIVHFMDGAESEVWSLGSGYGGNSLLGKKCISLRIASDMARREGWLAEHMLILGITNPRGVKRYIAAAFPSACGKTNLAMMRPALPGWKIEVVGDDIAWMRVGADGRLRAVNPEFGFFGVAPGTSMESNPNAMLTIERNTIFTNVALTEDGDVWWEGMSAPPHGATRDWKRQPWQPTFKANGKQDDSAEKVAAHKNSRFTTPLTQCPVLDDAWDSPEGVPIDAVIFGGRREDTMPLVFQSFSWRHGTFLGASMRSKATAAADQSGLVSDPMAMKPFIGYNVKDYWQHWLDMEQPGRHLPHIFHVNWFQKSAKGGFRWPGFGENARVLEWVLKRVEGTATAQKTAIGYVPAADGLNLDDIKDFDRAELPALLAVNKAEWEAEVAALNSFYSKDVFENGCDKPVPAGILHELRELEARVAGLKA
jgi:phosphoenolpyruvate carboxykinase (GTP)